MPDDAPVTSARRPLNVAPGQGKAASSFAKTKRACFALKGSALARGRELARLNAAWVESTEPRRGATKVTRLGAPDLWRRTRPLEDEDWLSRPRPRPLRRPPRPAPAPPPSLTRQPVTAPT